MVTVSGEELEFIVGLRFVLIHFYLSDEFFVPSHEFEFQSETSIVVITPAMTDGDWYVEGYYYAGDNAYTDPLYFEVAETDPPSLASIAPTSGSIFGGDTVTVFGTGLSEVHSVTFGGEQATDLTPNSDGTQLQVTTPPGNAPGFVNVEIFWGNGASALDASYRYFYPANDFDPAEGTLPDAAFSGFYSVQFIAQDAQGTFSYSLIGDLPDGLSFDPASHTLSGTPAERGTFDFRIVVSGQSQGGAEYSLTVQPKEVTSFSPFGGILPDAVVGTPIQEEWFEATDAEGDFTYSIVGALPNGVSFDPDNGILSGTPMQAGEFEFTFVVSGDSAGEAHYILNVLPKPIASFTPPTGALPPGKVDDAYIQGFTGDDGEGSIIYAITAGALPDGLVLAPNGILAGTPEEDGDFSFTISATGDSEGSAAYTLHIAEADAEPDPPFINMVIPDNAVASGGEEITIYGHRLDQVLDVTFDGVSALDFSLSGADLLLVVPPGHVGGAELSIHWADGSAVWSEEFIYTAHPVTSYTPAGGLLTAATYGAPYSRVLTANDVYGDVVYDLTGYLPTGLTFDPVARRISGTPTEVGDFPLTFHVNGDSEGTKAYILRVRPANATAFDPPAGALSDAIFNGFWSQVFTATDAQGDVVYSLDGALPAGMSFDAGTRTLSGAPTERGVFTFTIEVSGDSRGEAEYNLIVLPKPVADFDPAHGPLPDATFGLAYTQEFTVMDVEGTVAYTLVGDLPGGLSFDAPTRTLSGTPAERGNFNFSIEISGDSEGEAAYSLTVLPKPVSNFDPVAGGLANATIGSAWNQQFTANDVEGAVTYSLNGDLPDGLTFDAGTRTLSGTPIERGIFNFSIEINGDSEGEAAYSLIVLPKPVADFDPEPGALPDATIGSSYSQEFTVGDIEGIVTYTLAGDLPAGMSFDAASRTLSGTPTERGTFNFSIEVTGDSEGSAAYSLTVLPKPIAAFIPPAGSLPDGKVSQAYSQAIAGDGIEGDVTYSIIAGALPDGLTLAAHGLLSGIPSQHGDFNFTVGVSGDSEGSAAYTLHVEPPDPDPEPSIVDVVPATSSAKGGGSVTITGIHLDLVTAVMFGGGAGNDIEIAPDGLSLTVTIPPGTVGAVDLALVWIDGETVLTNGFTYTAHAVSDFIPPAGALPDGIFGQPYLQEIVADDVYGDVSYTISAGSLPDGLSLALDGTLSGTLADTGVFSFTVAVGGDSEGSAAYALIVAPKPVADFDPPAGALPSGMIAAAFSQQFIANDAEGTTTYSLVGILPGGLSFNAASRTLSGTPTERGVFNFTIEVTGESEGSGAYSLTIMPHTIAAFTPPAGTLPDGKVDDAYNQAISGADVHGDVTYLVTAGALPSGLSLAANGTLSGTPTEDGAFAFTVSATGDSEGSASYALQIAPPDPDPDPSIDTVLPASESAKGGATITISGEHLLTVNSVMFGAQQGTGLAIAPDGLSLTVTLPAAAVGPVDVTVSWPGGSATLPNGFSYTPHHVSSFVPAVLPGAQVGQAYLQAIEGDDVYGVVTYLLAGGDLPDGITLATDGMLSGTPTEHGDFAFTLGLSGDSEGDAPFLLRVDPADPDPDPSVTHISPQSGPVQGGTVVTISGANLGAVTGVSFGGIPGGNLTISGDGLSLTVTTPPGSYGAANVIVSWGTSSTTLPAAFTYLPHVVSGFTPPAGALPNAVLGSAYNVTITADDVFGTTTYAVSAGDLPNGLSLAATGLLSGTPTETGTFNFTVSVSGDSEGDAAYTLTILPKPLLSFDPGAGVLADALEGEPYNQQFTATDADGAVSYALVGTLPTGLSFDPATRTLSGTPTEAGDFNFTIEVSGDSEGLAMYTLRVNPAAPPPEPVLIPGALPHATAGQNFVLTFKVVDVIGNFTFTIAAGALPPGLTLNETTGVLSGTPLQAGVFNFTVEVGGDAELSVSYSLSVDLRSFDPQIIEEAFNTLNTEFLRTRQNHTNMALSLPTLADRRADQSASVPLSGNLTGNGNAFAFSGGTSLARIESAASRATEELALRAPMPLLNPWIDTTLSFHESDASGGHWGQFAMISVGVDYMVDDNLMIGMAVATDSASTRSGNGHSDGFGVHLGPYLSAELDENLFLDLSALYGRSWNATASDGFAGRFETDRLLLNARLQGQWSHGLLTVRPDASFALSHEGAGGYIVTDANGDTVWIASQDITRLRYSVGGTVSQNFELGDVLTLSPEIGVRLGATAHGDNLAESGFGSASAGFRLTSAAWTVRGSVDASFDTETLRSIGVKLGLSGQF